MFLLPPCSSHEREWLLDFGNGNGKWQIPFPFSGTGMWNVNGKFHSHFREQECKYIENSIPDFRERKIPGKSQENFIPIYGNGNANGKFHSHFRERECEWQIPFPTFGTGIGGRYSWEFPGSWIPAHGWWYVYDILWLHCMVLHSFTMLASARGLCLARRLYTTYNNMSLKQFMLLWYISRKQFTHFWHKCRKQIYFLWKVFARKIVPTGKLGFFRPLQRTRSL